MDQIDDVVASGRLAKTGRGDVRLAAGVLLLLAYMVPLFVPPGATPPLLVAPTLSERLFPGVPPLWMAVRLICLAVGAALVAGASTQQILRSPGLGRAPLPPPPRARRWIGLASAAALALAGSMARSFTRPEQELFLLALAVPPLLFVVRGSGRADAALGRAWLPVIAVLSVWIAIGALTWPHNPRMASAVDTWLGYQFLVQAAIDGRNLLTQGSLPGMSGVPLFLQGVSLLTPAQPLPPMALVQGMTVVWLLGSAAATAAASSHVLPRSAAPVVAAALLFSPFVLFFPLNSTAYFQGPLYTAALLLALAGIHVRRSSACVVAFGAISGIAVANPANGPLTLALGAVAAFSSLRSPRVPTAAVAAGLCCFLAALVPQLPDVGALRNMVQDYVATSGEWRGLERVLLGQRTPFDVPQLWAAGHSGSLDIPLGALLSPFASPRTPIRLWGDALLDPLGAVFTAVGIAAVLRDARRCRVAALLLILLGAALLPAFTSSYDRPSHTRGYCAPVLLALFAGVGFEVLRRRLLPRVSAIGVGCLGAAGIAAGGSVLFHVVNPAILAESSLALAVRLRDATPVAGGMLLLEHPGPEDLSWLYTGPIAALVPHRPLAVRRFEGVASVANAAGAAGPVAEILLATPALDADRGVVEAVCRRWPNTAVYTLLDRAGESRLLAMRPEGGSWQPRWPEERWSVRTCRPDRPS